MGGNTGGLHGGGIDRLLFGDRPKAPRERGTLSNFGEQLLQETGPLRQALIDRSTEFVDGNLDVSNTPQFRAVKAVNENQFRRAKDDILSQTATGGALSSALAEAEIANAIGLGVEAGNISEQEQQNAIRLVEGATGAGLNAIGGAGQLSNQIELSNNQRSMQQEADFHGFVTNVFAGSGSKGGGGGM